MVTIMSRGNLRKGWIYKREHGNCCEKTYLLVQQTAATTIRCMRAISSQKLITNSRIDKSLQIPNRGNTAEIA